MVTVTPGNDAPVSSDTNPPSAAPTCAVAAPGMPNAIADTATIIRDTRARAIASSCYFALPAVTGGRAAADAPPL